MGGGERSCDAPSAAVFSIGLVAGTMCIIASKTLFEGKARGVTGEVQTFQPPVFETFIMFFGMVFALPLYLFLEAYKRVRAHSDAEARAKLAAEPKVTAGMVFSLGVPAVFDLSSVLFLMAGLMHIPASMWMLLRGGCIVFVALMKQFALGSPLTPSMWIGVAVITVAVCLVGISPLFAEEEAPAASSKGNGEPPAAANDAVLGVLLTLAGTFMQSLQYAYEEKVMSGDTPAPPWLLIGMEGVFGSLLTVFVVYPLAGIVPGADHGVFENVENVRARRSALGLVDLVWLGGGL